MNNSASTNSTNETTVLIAMYNGSKTIETTIKSVLDQTTMNITILICDDGSTDESIKKVLAINNEQITLIRNDINIGLSKTRNKLLSLVKTKWVAFIDQDDTWRHDKIERQIDLMKLENCAMCHTYYNFINKRFNIKKLIKSKRRIDYRDLLNGHTPGASSVLINTEHFSKLSEFCDDRIFDSINDYIIWLYIFRGTNHYSICLEEPMMNYSFNGNNLSRNKLLQLYKHFCILKNIEKVGLYRLIISVCRNILNKIKGYIL
ncbi:glycosyltransferase [Gammaproteobacteria bacterium]|nr:glycosyltransferase [Gammaproteobacteria bacterium]